MGVLQREVYVLSLDEFPTGRYRYQGLRPLPENATYEQQMRCPWLYDRPRAKMWPSGEGLEVSMIGRRTGDITIEMGGIFALNPATTAQVESCLPVGGYERLQAFARRPTRGVRGGSDEKIRIELFNIVHFTDCLDAATSVRGTILYTLLAFRASDLPDEKIGLFKIPEAPGTVFATESGFRRLRHLRGLRATKVWSTERGPINFHRPPFVLF